MKHTMRTLGSAAAMLGVVLLAFVAYDATNLTQFLGLPVADEAAVALLGASVSLLLIALGLYSMRRSRGVHA